MQHDSATAAAGEGLYRAFGLTIRSALPLLELPAAEPGSSVDIAVAEAEVPPELPGATLRFGYFQGLPGRVLIFIEGVARYLAWDGEHVAFEREPGVSDDEVRAFLLTVVMGALLHQREDLVLHGSAVAIDGEAVAFLGQSGAGKSTMAAAFRRRGHPVLTDDLCVVRQRADGRTMVQPSFPHMKLWLDSLEKLEVSPDGLRRIRHKEGKRALPLGEEFTREPRPLRKMYLLRGAPQSRPTIVRVEGPNVFRALRNQTYRFGLLREMAEQPRHFQQAMDLAQTVPLALALRPADGFQLDELVALIEADLGKAPRVDGPGA